MTKLERALLSCEQVIEGIEDGTISTSSAMLQCSKIARLTNDQESLIWLQYEYGGYPRDNDGRILSEAWELAYKNGRGYNQKGQKYIFTELASELEQKIEAQQNAIKNFTTQGTSVGGENAYIAMNNLTSSVSRSTSDLVQNISINQKRLASLQAKYYEYALVKQIELTFGNIATDIFANYRERVDNGFSELSKETILKLQAIEGKIDSDNPELYSQALATCRRLFENVSIELFNKYFPDYTDKMFKTKAGKTIDVSGDHYKNKLSAVIETIEEKSVNKTLVGSNIIYLIDWIDNLHNLHCKGVHINISREDATKAIIQTYICLGDILNMQ